MSVWHFRKAFLRQRPFSLQLVPQLRSILTPSEIRDIEEHDRYRNFVDFMFDIESDAPLNGKYYNKYKEILSFIEDDEWLIDQFRAINTGERSGYYGVEEAQVGLMTYHIFMFMLREMKYTETRNFILGKMDITESHEYYEKLLNLPMEVFYSLLDEEDLDFMDEEYFDREI